MLISCPGHSAVAGWPVRVPHKVDTVGHCEAVKHPSHLHFLQVIDMYITGRCTHGPHPPDERNGSHPVLPGGCARIAVSLCGLPLPGKCHGVLSPFRSIPAK